MKNLTFFLAFFVSCAAYSQSLYLFNADTTNFPVMSAEFYAWDANNQQITNFSPSDFELTENGQPRTVTNVFCPPPAPPKALSTVITIDVSGSMSSGNLNNAKEAARAWIQGMPSGSECCITSFTTANFFNQDFTKNKDRLLKSLNTLSAGGGTAFNAGFIDPMAGALLAAEKGKHKKVVIFITDGLASGSEQAIINKANAIGATVFCVTLGMSCPAILQNISKSTGGDYFDNITTIQQARETYMRILHTVQSEPCTIEWESGISCAAGKTNLVLKLLTEGLTAATKYQSPDASVAKLTFEPSYIKFLMPEVGVLIDTTVKVTALGADFNVSNITGSNAAFDINPKSFFIAKGETKDISVSYLPADSGYVYCRFDVETDVCPAKMTVSGGWPGKLPIIKTIKLIKPNGGEVLLVGSDTTITWEGILEDEPVKIEYTTNNGADWITIADTASGLSYKWRVPKTPSNQCLARVTAAAKTYSYCDNPDVELCGKIWMGCNLDVEYYRNGEPIRHCETDAEWQDANSKQEGAWCYYDNDPENGAIYGKLYNWYAVNDPRGLAPEGWHVPTDEEWKELEMCLGMSQSEADGTGYRGTDQGSQLAGRADLWIDGALENNADFGTSGFSALPGGYRSYNGPFYNIGRNAYWWSSSELNASNAWYRYLYYYYSEVHRLHGNKANGFSVRAVRD